MILKFTSVVNLIEEHLELIQARSLKSAMGGCFGFGGGDPSCYRPVGVWEWSNQPPDAGGWGKMYFTTYFSREGEQKCSPI